MDWPVTTVSSILGSGDAWLDCSAKMMEQNIGQNFLLHFFLLLKGIGNGVCLRFHTQFIKNDKKERAKRVNRRWLW